MSRSANYTSFLKKLRSARIQASLRQVDVAIKLNKPQSFVSKVETGERRLDVTELHELAKLYKKNLDDFVK